MRTPSSPTLRRIPLLIVALLPACSGSEEAPLWDAANQRWKSVPVEIVDGAAIVGGDVNLGPIEGLRERAGAGSNKALPDPDFGRWPDGEVPYVIDAAFERQNRALIQDVFRQWENGTGVSFIPRKPEHDRYVDIVPTRGTCTVYPYAVPVRAEVQPWCFGHEIGHVLGLLHEHQRRDRADHVDVRMPVFRRSQYRPFPDVEPCGPYDLASVMHYQDSRIRALPDRPITRRDNVISDGDRRAVAAIYGGGSCDS
jgi:hypothetical protein